MYFDLTALIREIARESDSMSEIVDRFTEAVKQPLGVSINTLRQDDPERVPTGPALSTVFVTFEDGQSVIFLFNFRVRFDGDEVIVSAETQKIETPENQHVKLMIGLNEEMSAYNAGNPDWAARDVVKGISHLIGLEITAHPDEVGLPIDIFRLKAGSGRWIKSKQECVDGGSLIWDGRPLLDGYHVVAFPHRSEHADAVFPFLRMSRSP